jgi:thymidylate kinase
MPHARLIFEVNIYTCIKYSSCHCIYYKFIKGELFLFDLCSDYNFYFDFFPKVRFSDKGNIKLGRDLFLNKAIKKFSRDGSFSDADLSKLIGFFDRPENFSTYPKSLPKNDIDVQLIGNLIVKYRWLGLIRFRFQNFINNYKKGKSFAFIGPDGSGKGFFIDKLKSAKSVKVIYMGDWFFKMQPLYSLLMNLPSPSNRFLYLFYYIENLVRRLKVAFWVALGKTVFIDRFPGTNTPVTLTGFPGFINRLAFKMTPKPDLFVVLHATPEVVFERKQELSVCQIAEIQDKQKKLIINYPNVVINTEDLDNSLNFLLEKLYEI